MKTYFFREETTVYYTIQAENESEAWEKLSNKTAYIENDQDIEIDTHECFLDDCHGGEQ